ncbi:MAG: STAS domain-containing protein, partial [Clostridia bacterium]|nr:STAS domain-containing protein [Clostridia bacterium]
VTVVLSGELDHCTAPEIRAQLDDILRDGRITHMVLDMENLTFMDSSGIGVLLGRLKALQLRGGDLSVKNMQPSIAKLFRLTGMHRVIGVLEQQGGRR